MNKDEVKKIAVANGFKLKEQPDGTFDLNPCVYEFAVAFESHVINRCEKYKHVGYTNGANIKLLHGTGYGAMYETTDQNCFIPLYMLESHLHRIETTGGDPLTTEKVAK